MGSPLDAYLAQVAAQLKGVPAPERELQLEEIRQHLGALIEDKQEQGLSESDAVEAALAQFGAPQQVGRELGVALEAVVSISRGLMVGGLIGVGMFTLISALIWGLSGDTQFTSGALLPYVAMAAVGGAVASLFGRGFVRRARAVSVSDDQPVRKVSKPRLSAPFRLFLLGMGRGAIGGAIYGTAPALNITWDMSIHMESFQFLGALSRTFAAAVAIYTVIGFLSYGTLSLIYALIWAVRKPQLARGQGPISR